MPDSTLDHERAAADRKQDPRFISTESTKYFEAERLEERRKRFATFAIWAGLLSLLLLLIPNPIAWLFGPVAVLLGLHALLRIHLQPTRYAGTFRALFGLGAGLAATVACHPWISTFRYWHGRAVCESNLQAVAVGLHLYHHEWETFPPDLQTLIRLALVTHDQCQCFIDEDMKEPEPDFAYVVGLQPDDPADWIWLYDEHATHEGGEGIILYFSGEAKNLKPAAFQAELERFPYDYERARGSAPLIRAKN